MVDAEFIDSEMKLPTTQSIKPPISANNDGLGPNTAVKNSQASPLNSNKTVSPTELKLLPNTWAKVKSSQPLSPEQTNKLVSRANNADSTTNQQTTKQQTTKQQPTDQKTTKQQIPNQQNTATTDGQNHKTHISSELNQQITQLTRQLTESAEHKHTIPAELKLFLIKLETQQGVLSLLSQQAYPKGSFLLISLDSKGTWQLQQPPQGFSLNNMAAQFSGNHSAPPALDLAALTKILEGLNPSLATSKTHPQTNMLNPQDLHALVKQTPPKLGAIPSSMLQSGKTIDLSAVQNAVKNSGLTFENKLAQLLNTPASQSLNQPSAQSSIQITKPSISPSANADQTSKLINTLQAEKPDFKGRFKQVEQQVNQWVKQLTSELKHPKTAINLSDGVKPQSLAPSSRVTTTTATQVMTEKATALAEPALTVNSQLSSTITNGDNKSWLIKNQNLLITQLNQTMMKNDSFIPNWASVGSFKNAGELNALFNLLLAPKQGGQSAGQSIWPNNLSVQSQINQTLQLLLSHNPDTEKDAAQTQLLRQIFNINQSLMKMQHDQIHNRLGQQQPDSTTQLQMSIPYAHHNQIQWTDFELKEFKTGNNPSEKTTGWHLILRFEQDTPQAFAVETQLKQNQLSVVLWATEKLQLKKLNQDIPLFKHKLNHAGFQLESISSKHGSPSKIQKSIQQSLVDVHT